MGGRARRSGDTSLSTSPADETEKWAKVVKFAGIKAN
jgi:hypothetical protein